MSGIACIFNLDGRPVEQRLAENAVASLAGLEEDASRLWLEGPLALGMAAHPRGLVGGPSLLLEDDCALVADARLDNRDELMAELEVPAAARTEVTDAYLIRRAYGRWGTDCPSHFIGEFVFVLWDCRTRQVIAVRDQLGIRVLYIHRTASVLAIASSPKALLSLPSVPRRLSRSKIADWLVMDGAQVSCLYQGIDYLPAAHVLSVSANATRSYRYWALDLARRVVYRKDEDYVEAFRSLFDEAVACRLRGSSPVGVLMSGGLDSSSVAVVAADQLAVRGERLTAFTHVPPRGFHAPSTPGYYNDESPFVDAIRDWNGNMDLRYLRGEGKGLFDGLEQFFETAWAPLVAVGNRLWLEEGVEAARSLGVRVLLGGGRGNLTMSYTGYNRYRELALHGRWPTLLRELRGSARTGQLPMRALIKHMLVAPLLPRRFWSLRERLRVLRRGPAWSKYSAINPELAQAERVQERLYAGGMTAGSGVARDGRAQRMAFLDNGAADNAAAIEQAWRLVGGVCMTDPTGDLRVVEYCLAIPLDQYLRNGQTRYLIRRAMEGRLPPSVLHNTRRGRQSADWYVRLSAMRGEIGAELDRLERNDTARCCLDLARMRRLLEHWPKGNWADAETEVRYESLLSRGLMMGRFIRWFEQQ